MNLYNIAKYSALFTAACLITTSCKDKHNPIENKIADVSAIDVEEIDMAEVVQAPNEIKAYAIIHPAEDSEVIGVVSFTEVPGGVRIIADVAGLSPGLHGFHIHEHGDCGGPGMENAGGHYNPTNTPHGGPDSPPDQRHVGDFGNLEANKDGIAHYNRVDTVISLRGEHSIIGKSVMVHADPDDLKSQPSGNAGKRIGCGVVVEGRAK